MIRTDHLLSRRPEAASRFFHGVKSPEAEVVSTQRRKEAKA